jgi:2',3'-cyclic-nucleotide 2'-phosphodiesterase (5'-nucleotidase family)
MLSDQSELPQRLVTAIQNAAARNDLAAVILHLNDTYRVEPRLPDIPGLARIAQLVQLVTSLVKELTGEDRTLVVHAGDFLSPSFMTTKLGFAGEQMVDLLNCCDLDYATIGNHEFDVKPDQLKQRLTEARFPLLCANLQAPTGFSSLPHVAYWPAERPFLAIAGLAGEQTIEKAKGASFNFEPKDYKLALRDLLDIIRPKKEIGAFVLLTHMGRDEDKAVQQVLRYEWSKSGAAFVLGGHDHDISWQEPGANSILCKNLSNARTVTAVVLTKSAVAAPAPDDFPRSRYRKFDDELRLVEEWLDRDLDRNWDSAALPKGAQPFERIVERVIDIWRNRAPSLLPQDFVQAFATRLRETAMSRNCQEVEKEDYLEGAEWYLFTRACADALEPFRLEGSGIVTLSGKDDLSNLTVAANAHSAVECWLQAAKAKTGVQGDEVVIDFTGALPAGAQLNGQDIALRAGSTDFGNFVADAVQCATAAQLALINAGSFRVDDMIGPVITLRDLQETFLYDHEHAVAVVDLTPYEVGAMCRHAQTRSGQGGFLQVSHGVEDVTSQSGVVRTALIRHMLVNDEDKFQSLLASLRGCEPGDIPSRLASTGDGYGLIDLVSKGAKGGIPYCAANRLTGASETDERKSALISFVDCIDRYVAVCEAHDVEDDALWFLDIVRHRSKLPGRLATERMLVRLTVLWLAMIWGIEWVRRELYSDLACSELVYRRNRFYQHYLDKALTFFDFRIIRPRLEDEEGRAEIPGTPQITAQTKLNRASAVYFSDAQGAIEIFAKRVDEFLAACRENGVQYPECRRLLEPNPARQPLLVEPLQKARYEVRHLLFMHIVGCGLERVRSDYVAEVKELDNRRGGTPQYCEYFTATLSFFDIIVQYGLLLNEED